MWNWYVPPHEWDWKKWETWQLNWIYVDNEPEMTSRQGAD